MGYNVIEQVDSFEKTSGLKLSIKTNGMSMLTFGGKLAQRLHFLSRLRLFGVSSTVMLPGQKTRPLSTPSLRKLL